MTAKQGLSWAAAAVVFALSMGCGGKDIPEIAPVEGKVTLDGQPLPGVLVSFYPQSGGRPGTGVTDDEGNYELTYVQGEEGTKLGPSKVEVTMVWPDGEPTPGVKDKVPAAYHGTNTTLSFDVKAGDNLFNIEMKSSGGP